MKKRVVIINDELGTMALGFAKAGYDISAICIGQNDKNAIKELKTNWGNTVRIVDSESYPYCNAIADLDAECIAGRIFLNLARLEAEGNLAIKIILFWKRFDY